MAGRNEFNIPVYYEMGVTDSPCGITYSSPYSVPDSVRKHLGNEGRVQVVFFPLPDLEFEKVKVLLNEEFGSDELILVNAQQIASDSSRYENWKKCVFFINNPWQAVLLDREGRIRGYYGASSREELDRLKLEIKILLKKY